VALHFRQWTDSHIANPGLIPVNHALVSDVNKDLGPKAKAKNLVPEATGPHHTHTHHTRYTVSGYLNELQIRNTAEMVTW